MLRATMYVGNRVSSVPNPSAAVAVVASRVFDTTPAPLPSPDREENWQEVNQTPLSVNFFLQRYNHSWRVDWSGR